MIRQPAAVNGAGIGGKNIQMKTTKPKFIRAEFVFHNGSVEYLATDEQGKVKFEVFDTAGRALLAGTTRQAANKTNASIELGYALKSIIIQNLRDGE